MLSVSWYSINMKLKSIIKRKVDADFVFDLILGDSKNAVTVPNITADELLSYNIVQQRILKSLGILFLCPSWTHTLKRCLLHDEENFDE